MKIIFSRKGFDSDFGGLPNPILPDGTLLSFPIPSNDKRKFSELAYKGKTYDKIIHELGLIAYLFKLIFERILSSFANLTFQVSSSLIL